MEKPTRTILKFDSGADGFKFMIYILTVGAVGVLGLGIYFLFFVFKGL